MPLPLDTAQLAGFHPRLSPCSKFREWMPRSSRGMTKVERACRAGRQSGEEEARRGYCPMEAGIPVQGARLEVSRALNHHSVMPRLDRGIHAVASRYSTACRFPSAPVPVQQVQGMDATIRSWHDESGEGVPCGEAVQRGDCPMEAGIPVQGARLEVSSAFNHHSVMPRLDRATHAVASRYGAACRFPSAPVPVQQVQGMDATIKSWHDESREGVPCGEAERRGGSAAGLLSDGGGDPGARCKA